MNEPIHQHQRKPAAPVRQARPSAAAPGPVHALMDRLGNRGLKALRGRLLQRKTEGVSGPADPLELAADRVAERVLGMPADTTSVPVPGTAVPGAVQRDALSGAAVPPPPGPTPRTALAGGLLSGLDAGRPLPGDTRRFMEERFGHPFGGVRIHTGERAATVARSVAAKAFTIGSEIVFGDGRWAPQTREGRRLLAHELAHVVQQGGEQGAPAPESVTEGEADRVGRAVVDGRAADVSARAVPGAVQRDPQMTRGPSSAITTSYVYRGREGAISFVLVEGEAVAVIEDRAEKVSQSWDGEWRILTVVAKADYWDAKAKPKTGAYVPGVNRVVIRVNHNVTVVEMVPPQPGKPPKPQAKRPPRAKPPIHKPPVPVPPATVDPSTPGREPKPEPDSRARTVAPGPVTDAEYAADRVARLSDSELGTMGPAERAALLDVLADTPGILDVHSVARLFATTPDDELTELLDKFFEKKGALLRKLADRVAPGADAITLAQALTRIWERSRQLPDDGRARWRPGPLGTPVRMTNGQYDRMLASAPKMLRQEIERLEESVAWQDQTRSWRTEGLGSVMGGIVDVWSGATRPPTALEAVGDPRAVFLGPSPYSRLHYARTSLAGGALFQAGEALAAARAENALLMSAWNRYGGQTREGGERLIADLEKVQAASDLTLIVLSLGQGAVVVGSIRGALAGGGRVLLWQAGKGAMMGGGLNAARQGIQMLDDPRKEFSGWEFAGSSASGALLGPVLARSPGLMIPLSAVGVRSGIHEFAEGNEATAAFDVGTAVLLPLGHRAFQNRSFGQWMRPRILAGRLYLGSAMEGAGKVPGLGTGPWERPLMWQFNQPEITMTTGGTTAPASPGMAARGTLTQAPIASPSPVVPPALAETSGGIGGWMTAPRSSWGADLFAYGSTPIIVQILPGVASPAPAGVQPAATAPVFRESVGARAMQRGIAAHQPAIAEQEAMGFLAPGSHSGATASARTARSITTGVRADVAEVMTYNARLARGEIGLLAPVGSNIPGPDSATAVRLANGDYEIVVIDTKSRVSSTSRFGRVRANLPGTWQNAISDALSPGRLDLGDPVLEAALVDAWSQGRVRIARDTVDFSPQGQGAVRLDN